MKNKILYLFCIGIAFAFSSCAIFRDSATEEYANIETQKVLIAKDGKSTIIGAKKVSPIDKKSVALLDRSIDQIAKQIATIDQAQVESFTDLNKLKGLRISFKCDELFSDSEYMSLNNSARVSLIKLAKILNSNPLLDLLVIGHSDNVGTLKENQTLSSKAAQSVSETLTFNGVQKKQIKKTVGRNFSDPKTSNETAAGRSENRRVEILVYASKDMIDRARKTK